MDGPSPDTSRRDTFDDRLASIACLLAAKKNIVVLAGAGISASCGIPDFRSTTGLYNTLNYQELGLTSPEDLFDIETFRDNPRPFFKFAHSLYPGSIEPGASHKFLAWLDREKKLLRAYTQNIDTLEQAAGVRAEKVVYAHGSLLGATCMKCRAKYAAADIADEVRSGTVPLCRRPRNKKAKPSTESSEQDASISDPPAKQRASLRRSAKSVSSESESNFEALRKQGLCCGVVKPNITFFGEKLNNDVGRKLQKDYETADALIVMGTSLSVAPISKVVEFLPPGIPRILINRNLVRLPKKSNSDDDGFAFDYCLLGNCDDVVNAIEEKMKCTHRKIDLDNTDGLVVKEEAWLQGQPKESVLLFPGAVTSGAPEPEPEQKLVVHCDECQTEIVGEVWCCKTCFDYDLCETCYSNASSTHFGGTHDFAVES